MTESDASQLFYTNLLLLGFDSSAMESKHNIAFNKSMFAVPNRKGFEIVAYYLFGRLDSGRCKREFRDCWPILDKKDAPNFRKASLNWLQQIFKEDVGFGGPLINAALLMTPGGEKFIRFMFHFSRHVIQQVAINENGADKSLLLCPEVNARMGCSTATVMRSIQAETCRQRQAFLEANRKHEAIQHEWSKATGELISEYKQCSRLIKDYEIKLKNVTDMNTAESSASKDRKYGSRSLLSEKNSAALKNIQRVWQKIELVCERLEKERHVIDSVVNESADELCIDSARLEIKIPDVLLHNCHEQLQKKNIDSLYTDRKVNLLNCQVFCIYACEDLVFQLQRPNVMHVWNASLQLYLNKLQQVSLPDYTDQLPQVESALQKQRSCASEAERLRLHLEFELLPQLKNSVENLRKDLNLKISSRNTSLSTSHQQVAPHSALMPPTPPVSFEAADSPVTAEVLKRYRLSGVLQNNVSQTSTPEGAVLLKKDVEGKVMMKRRSKIPHRNSSLLKDVVSTSLRTSTGEISTGVRVEPAIAQINMRRNNLQEVNSNHSMSSGFNDNSSATQPIENKAVRTFKKSSTVDQQLHHSLKSTPTFPRDNSRRSFEMQSVPHNVNNEALSYDDMLADQLANAVMGASPLLKDSDLSGRLSAGSGFLSETLDGSLVRDLGDSLRDVSRGSSVKENRGAGDVKESKTRRSYTLPLRESNADVGPLSSTLDISQSLQDMSEHEMLHRLIQATSGKKQRKDFDQDLLSVSGTRTPSSINGDFSDIEHDVVLCSTASTSTLHGADSSLSTIHSFESAAEHHNWIEDGEFLTPHVVHSGKHTTEQTIKCKDMPSGDNYSLKADSFKVPTFLETPFIPKSSAVYNSLPVKDSFRSPLRNNVNEDMMTQQNSNVMNEELHDTWTSLMNTATPCLPVRRRVNQLTTQPMPLSYENVPSSGQLHSSSHTVCAESVKLIPNQNYLVSNSNPMRRRDSDVNKNSFQTCKNRNVETDLRNSDNACMPEEKSNTADIQSLLMRYKSLKMAAGDSSFTENKSPELQLHSNLELYGSFNDSSRVISEAKARRVDGGVDRMHGGVEGGPRVIERVSGGVGVLGSGGRLSDCGLDDESFNDIHEMMMNLSATDSPISYRNPQDTRDLSEASYSRSSATETVPTANLIDLS